MGLLDVTIVNVAFPEIECDLAGASLDAWTLMAVAGGIVAVLAVALGRVRAVAPAAAPAEAAA
jgi:hypothetical protein